MAKARVGFTIDEGGGKTTTIKKGDDVPREVAESAKRAGLCEDSAPAAAAVASGDDDGEKSARRRGSKG